MSYEHDRWCAMWVRNGWEARVNAADRKRKRKAAKRRRDADLTRLGRDLARYRIGAWWYIDRGAVDTCRRMRAIRRGEAHP